MRISSFFVLLLLGLKVYSQDVENEAHQIKLSGYVDTYFSGYDNDLDQDEFQPFITAGARDNSFGVNVAQLGLSYNYKTIRSHIILHYGDIPQATWSSDFNTIQEANVGLRLSKGLWLDAGFFATHIGTESFLPKNNMLSSTAFKTFNEPFYQAGAKLTYTNTHWEFQLWVANGYNSFLDNNDAKSIGAYINYKLSPNTSIVYTNLYGRESEDALTVKQNRFYQNLYINHHWNNKVFLQVGFDYGIQTNSDLEDADKTAQMFAGLLTARYQFNPRFSITGRAEIFNDESGFISGTVSDANGNISGVELSGFTFGAEYKPLEGCYLRAEARHTRALNNAAIFVVNGNSVDQRNELLMTLGLEVEKLFNL